MYRIAVCDDETEFLDQFTVQLTEIFSTEQNLIHTYQSGRELFYALDHGKTYDVFFIDIQIAGENGITLAQQLYIKQKESILIYISAMEQYVFQPFQTELFSFIRKEKMRKDLQEMMPELQKEWIRRKRKVVLQAYNQMFCLDAQKVLYVERQNKYSIIRMEKESIQLRYKISEIEQIWKDQGFLRIHKEYLVNVNRICKIGQEDLVLDGQICLPVSHSKRREVREAFVKNIFGEE